MTSLQSRLLVCVIGVPLLLWVVLWAPMLVVALALAALSAIGAWEMMKCIGSDAGWRSSVTITAGMMAMFYHVNDTMCLPLLVVLMMTYFAMAVWKAGEIRLLDILGAMFSLVAIPYAFTAFLRLNGAGLHRAFLLLPFVFSFASDTFAYIVGCTMGKHKLAPKVSPKKSVEGAVGGLLGNVVGGLVFAFVMNTWFGQSIHYGLIALVGLFCSVVAQLGDLSFSLIKREFGVKDYGKLFLAHGGVLDRFDSVLFVAPVLEILMKMYMG